MFSVTLQISLFGDPSVHMSKVGHCESKSHHLAPLSSMQRRHTHRPKSPMIGLRDCRVLNRSDPVPLFGRLPPDQSTEDSPSSKCGTPYTPWRQSFHVLCSTSWVQCHTEHQPGGTDVGLCFPS
jgi:hypothetical protein